MNAPSSSEQFLSPRRTPLIDLNSGVKDWRTWTTWAWLDIKGRYRRSIIGPFWLTLSLGVTICGMSAVFGAVFNIPLKEIVPYIALGMMIWFFISSVISESCTLFIAHNTFLLEMPRPYSILLFKHIFTLIIILMHHLLIIVGIAIIFGLNINLNTLHIIPGFALVLLISFAIAASVALIATRFRDIQPIIVSVLQLFMFVTPIFWKPNLLEGRRSFIVDFNPFFHIISAVRNPLLGEPVTALSYFVLFTILLVSFAAAAILYTRYHRRIIFWI